MLLVQRLKPLVLLLLLTSCGETPVGRQALCPLRQGAWWDYHCTDLPGTERRRVVSVAAVADLVVARLETEAEYAVGSYWVVDAPDGIRLLPARGRRPSLEALRNAPLWLPATVEPGQRWSYQGALPFAVGGDGLGPPPQVRAAFTVAAREVVAVGGRRYDAWRLEAETVHELVPPLRARERFWYAPGVGLVRHETRVEGRGTVTLELLAHGGGGR
ncbi:MAG: hypothetical protein HUU35_04835 [Armatimonadetes bacterium]|nr:hypothetical protein [Armatimonadota bacterium]